MSKLTRFFTYPISSPQFDAGLPRWVGYIGCVGPLTLVAITLPRHASHTGELLLGVGLGVLLSLLFLLFGNMLGWLEKKLLAKPMPHRQRIGEYISYASFPLVFGLGLFALANLSLTKPGFTIGVLLILCVGLAGLCLGILSSLMRVGQTEA